MLVQLHAHKAHVGAVGHRVVHGVARFVELVLIDDAGGTQMSEFAMLALLHKTHNLPGVPVAFHAFAGAPQLACFDTPPRPPAGTEPPIRIAADADDAGVRGYGFHGLSYESILAQMMVADPVCARPRGHRPPRQRRRVCAMHEGRSVTTTMSFSQLDGLHMGTRCGRFIAAVVLHLIQQQGRSVDDVSRLLLRESGLLALSGPTGVSSDMRETEASTLDSAAMAVHHFVEHVLRKLTGMAAALCGIDTLVFTGGFSANAAASRACTDASVAWLGLVDAQVLRSNEEEVIAGQTAHLNARWHRNVHRPDLVLPSAQVWAQGVEVLLRPPLKSFRKMLDGATQALHNSGLRCKRCSGTRKRPPTGGREVL